MVSFRLENASYDEGKSPDCNVNVMAVDEAEADEKGDAKITKLIGECATIVSEKVK